MNILSIDFGTKNIGLAWVDTGIGAALPFGVAKNVKEVSEIVTNEKINLVVVGLPLGTDGKENANTERVRKFSEELKKNINAPIEFVDERFTSFAADRMGEGVSRDERSAMLILETYLERTKNK
jgi:putative Holliday junction resolvase